MNGAVKLSILQFSFIYILLLIVLAVMHKSKIDKTKLMIIASVRMTVQLVLAGFILQYFFENPKPIYTLLFVGVMVAFSVYLVLKKNKGLNRNFQFSIGFSLAFSGLFVLIFFICIVMNENFFIPQYTIPIAGMIIGNAMTGMSLGMKAFTDEMNSQRKKIDTLLNLGCSPKLILKPFVNNALETALLPTMNSMLGMGIIFLPGMMTGQILSGTMPTTAILYQIAIMIANCTAVCLATFLSLNFGYKTLVNKYNQIIFHS